MDQLKINWSRGERSIGQGTQIRLGRDPSCEIVLDNPNVSREHAKIWFTDGRWVIEDLGSAQGTWVEGRRVRSLPLSGTVSVVLGEAAAGEQIRVTTPETAES